jgi:hypothetical protein
MLRAGGFLNCLRERTGFDADREHQETNREDFSQAASLHNGNFFGKTFSIGWTMG